MLRRQALAEDAKPRKWAVKGMRTPKDRRLEREFQEALKLGISLNPGFARRVKL